MRKIFALAAWLCLAAGLPMPAFSQTVVPPPGAGSATPPRPAPSRQPACDRRDRIVAWLARHYRESPRLSADAGRGFRFEFLATGQGTWTLLVVRPDGRACVVAAGLRWAWQKGV